MSILINLSFELAAKLGFKNSAKAAKAVIMEPIMKLEVITPEENMGDIVGDLNRRRGQVSDMGDRAGAKTVKATVPLSEMFGYVTTLRTFHLVVQLLQWNFHTMLKHLLTSQKK